MNLCHHLPVSMESLLLEPDTPQFHGGNPYCFIENLFQSVSFICASMYRENVHAIHIAMQCAQKSRHCVTKIDSQQQITKIGASRGATVGLAGLRLSFFGNLAEKASCVDDKTVLFSYTMNM